MTTNPLCEPFFDALLHYPPYKAFDAFLADPTVAALVRWASLTYLWWATDELTGPVEEVLNLACDALPDDLRDWLRGQR